MIAPHQSDLHLFWSLRNKSFDFLTSSYITCQMIPHHQSDLLLFCSLRNKPFDSLTSSNITCQMIPHHNSDLHLFCSLWSKPFDFLTSSNIRCQMMLNKARSFIASVEDVVLLLMVVRSVGFMYDRSVSRRDGQVATFWSQSQITL